MSRCYSMSIKVAEHQDNRLSAAVVELIFDKHIEDLDIDGIILTKEELEKVSEAERWNN